MTLKSLNTIKAKCCSSQKSILQRPCSPLYNAKSKTNQMGYWWNSHPHHSHSRSLIRPASPHVINQPFCSLSPHFRNIFAAQPETALWVVPTTLPLERRTVIALTSLVYQWDRKISLDTWRVISFIVCVLVSMYYIVIRHRLKSNAAVRDVVVEETLVVFASDPALLQYIAALADSRWLRGNSGDEFTLCQEAKEGKSQQFIFQSLSNGNFKSRDKSWGRVC